MCVCMYVCIFIYIYIYLSENITVINRSRKLTWHSKKPLQIKFPRRKLILNYQSLLSNALPFFNLLIYVLSPITATPCMIN